VSQALAPSGLSAAPAEPANPVRPTSWLRSVSEFFLVGGLTPLLFPLSWLLRKEFGLPSTEYAVGFLFFYGAYVINDPHFAVTYVLFYRDVKARAFGTVFAPGQRARYLAAGFVVPVAIGVWAIAALAAKSAVSLGYLIQSMFLLVGWHYTKQGFGVLTVLAARRGVFFTSRERLAILAHCYAGWAYAWASPSDVGTVVEEKGVVYTTIAHSARLEHLTHAVFLSTILPLAWLLLQKRRREGRLPIASGLVALLCTVWSWTIYTSIDPLVKYMTPALHSVQYLYFVALLRGNEAREREGPPWFETSRRVRLGTLLLSALGLGWLLFHGAPAVLDSALMPRLSIRTMSDLGPTPYFAAIYAFVNIHHYAMDAVFWRRDNPTTRYLQTRFDG
jgi:hypothetical protein